MANGGSLRNPQKAESAGGAAACLAAARRGRGGRGRDAVAEWVAGRGYAAGMATDDLLLEVGGREVKVTNPGKVFFPEIGATKLDVVQYYLAVAEGALRGVYRRPTVLKRFTGGRQRSRSSRSGRRHRGRRGWRRR